MWPIDNIIMDAHSASFSLIMSKRDAALLLFTNYFSLTNISNGSAFGEGGAAPELVAGF